MAKRTAQTVQQPGYVKCSRCERTILKTAVVTVNGKVYGCPDCAQGKTCDCR